MQFVKKTKSFLRSSLASLVSAVTAFALFAALGSLGCSASTPEEESSVQAEQDALTTAIYQINCGSGAVSPFAADQFANGGFTWTSGTAVSTAGVANAAPAAVYQSERYGDHSYVFGGLTPGSSYTVRLHFAETKFTSVGQRRFNVLINGAQALSDLDIFASAGANKALVRDLDAVATSGGQINVHGTNIVDNAKFCGIEILSNSGGANQAPTVATPAAASSVTTTSAALSVLGADDGGEANLTYTWATTGTPPAAVSFASNGNGAAKNTTATFTQAGNYALTATIRDAAGASTTSSVNVTVPAAPPPTGGTPIYRVNCGAGAVSPFTADQFSNGGSTWTSGNAISTAGVANAAPAAVYQSERYGDHSYIFGSLTPGASYTVRMHFAETRFTSVGQRRFNVLINGAQALSNLDIFASAGANKALVRDVSAVATSGGQIAIRGTNIVDNAKFCGIELITSGGQSNQAPTVTTAAAANPNPVNGATATLSVLGADDGGEANLTYTWATTGTPPAAVSFSANASNAAKSTTATFGKAGNYSLSASIRDAGGSSVISNLNLVVNQKLTAITVSPSSAQVQTGGTQAFAATARDQFGNALTTQPSIAWAVSGGGTINAIGVFTASSSSGGPFTVSATSGATSGTASVTVTTQPTQPPPVTYTTDFNLTEFPLSEGGVWKHFGLDWTRVATAGGLAYGTQTGNGGIDDSYAYLSGFPPNHSASAVVHIDPAISTGTTHEVEILLRWADSDHIARGYECNFAYNGQYADIVRWNGPKGNYTYLVPTLTASIPGGLHEGDTVSAKIVGNVITTYVNGTQILSTSDNVFTDGNPGMGFWRGAPSGPQNDFGLTRFSATSVTQ